MWKSAETRRKVLAVKSATKILLFALLCPSLFAQARPHASVTTDRDGVGTLVLPDGSKFRTTLYGLKLLGELKTVRKLPYYVLSGLGCNGCDANTSLYIHSPSDGPMKNEGEQRRFYYPGRELDYQQNRKVVYRGRVFLGNCISGHPDAIVWFEKFLGEDKRWHSDIVVAEVQSDELVVKTSDRETPSVGEAETSLQRRQCHEIPGTTRFSEP
jgi:hypothetical protein